MSDDLICSLKLLDPILQFLTRATGQPFVSLQTLRGTVAGEAAAKKDISDNHVVTAPISHIPELSRRGILHVSLKDSGPKRSEDESANINCFHVNDMFSRDPASVMIGFPRPVPVDSETTLSGDKKKRAKDGSGLSGSTKTAAKRRMTALLKSIKVQPFEAPVARNTEQPPAEVHASVNCEPIALDNNHVDDTLDVAIGAVAMDCIHEVEEDSLDLEAKTALRDLSCLMWENRGGNGIDSDSSILPEQAKYAGFQKGRRLRTYCLSPETRSQIPTMLADALSICLDDEDANTSRNVTKRKLYCHQGEAIESALAGIHTIVCTSTGSGKSLCYLLPVLISAFESPMNTSILIFPTKALAQDQLGKINAILSYHPELQDRIRPATIDGDTAHSARSVAAESCNVILTNPDTLHAAILPNWRTKYRRLLGTARYIVIDEAHIYEGTFGAHVSLILSRLLRLCTVASNMCNEFADRASRKALTFIASSATIASPEQHFRLLCHIPESTRVKVLLPSNDGSPCSPKYFFTWNPPLLDINGNCAGKVKATVSPKNTCDKTYGRLVPPETVTTTTAISERGRNIRRRHPADDTARLLALAVKSGIRCIAFAKTRCLVEWIYEKCISKLREEEETAHLVEKVESYRGGYTAEVRRHIEERLFQNKLVGVVGTSALELGVDIGGIDLTLHCGYPGSYTSLMQQAGRAGRGGKTDRPSFSVIVCWNSPSEQYLWMNPKAALGRGANAPPCIPVDVSLVKGHLLCAAAELPLVGACSVASVFHGAEEAVHSTRHLSDYDLFGSADVYEEAAKLLSENGELCKNQTCVRRHPGFNGEAFNSLSAHPSVEKPWAQVSIRSIEPLQYSIVDLSHQLQGGRMDGIQSQKAVMDIIPYSRVFYHCFPGSIIMHRGKKYKVTSLTKPPCVNGNDRRSDLVAYAIPTKATYLTRAIQTVDITIVKRLETVELCQQRTFAEEESSDTKICAFFPGRTNELQVETGERNDSGNGADRHVNSTDGPMAGSGVVTIKRAVWGCAKLSPVTRSEISRTELSLPPTEFDTNAFWIDTEASTFNHCLPNYDAGVHALSHALLAVSPIFVSCASSDIDCDHTFKNCSRVLIYDARAGGGTHASEQVWKNLHLVLPAAVNLLECCATCCSDEFYDSGCPSCLQGISCMNFHDGLSRRAGLFIAKRMLKRLQEHAFIKRSSTISCGHEHSERSKNLLASPTGNECASQFSSNSFRMTELDITPRKRARVRALENAKDLVNARKRQIVVGRPSWPMDGIGGQESGVHSQIDTDGAS